MRKTGKSALYSTIKNAVKKLGISAEDATGIISYIKFMENNVSIEGNKKINSTEEIILSILNKNPNKSYSMQDIIDATGLKYYRVQTLLKDLKAQKKIKAVDYIAGSSGPSKVLYQTLKSPLKALKLVTEEQGYSTVNGFIKNNKKLLIKGVGVSTFASIVEEAGLTSYPLSLSIGISKGYKNSDLRKLATSDTNKKRPKANKVKRKYTRRAKVQPAEIQVNQEVQNKQLNLFSFFRKKKDDTSDLIKF